MIFLQNLEAHLLLVHKLYAQIWNTLFIAQTIIIHQSFKRRVPRQLHPICLTWLDCGWEQTADDVQSMSAHISHWSARRFVIWQDVFIQFSESFLLRFSGGCHQLGCAVFASLSLAESLWHRWLSVVKLYVPNIVVLGRNRKVSQRIMVLILGLLKLLLSLSFNLNEVFLMFLPLFV